MCECILGPAVAVCSPVEAPCQHDNEPQDSEKGGKYFYAEELLLAFEYELHDPRLFRDFVFLGP